MIKLLNKIKPTYIIIVLLASLAIFQFLLLHERKNSVNKSSVSKNESVQNTSCNYEINRVGRYRFIKPIADAKQECESEKYSPLKAKISKTIDSLKNNGTITTASVYFQDFKQNDWINCNDSEKFDPGSLLKVPLLIAYLKMEEDSPGILDKEFVFNKPNSFGKSPVFLSKAIQLGNKYSVHQLLNYTIAYSDNNAYSLLCQHVSVPVWKKTFTDLGLPEPDWFSPTYPITTKQYSVFMDALFNASYLSIKDSEYASELLSKCDFEEGIKSSIPDSVMLIHKFGESGDLHTKEFHESGIVYIHNDPYLITIMTKGRDMDKLPAVVSKLSKLIYNGMTSRVRG